MLMVVNRNKCLRLWLNYWRACGLNRNYCQRLSVHLTVFDWTHGGLSVSSLHTGMCRDDLCVIQRPPKFRSLILPKIEETVPSSVHNRYFSEVKISRLSSAESELDSPFPLCFKIYLPFWLSYALLPAARWINVLLASWQVALACIHSPPANPLCWKVNHILFHWHRWGK